MNERIVKIRDEKLGETPWQNVSERHAVLSSDFRTYIFEGTFQECVQFLKNSCPTGGCED